MCGRSACYTDAVLTGLQATAGEDQRIVFWSYPDGEKLREWNAPGKVYTLALSPDGIRLASRFWDGSTGNQVRILDGHRNEENGLAFVADGRYLISASRARNVGRSSFPSKNSINASADC